MRTQINFLGIRINLAPRSHRRFFVVFFYSAMLSWAVCLCVGFDRTVTFGLLSVVALALLLFVGYAGLGHEASDEREIHRRDHAFYVAHRQTGWLLAIAFFTVWLQGPNPLVGLLQPSYRRIFEALPRSAMFTLLMIIMTLPQAILLWIEPDMEEPEQAS